MRKLVFSGLVLSVLVSTHAQNVPSQAPSQTRQSTKSLPVAAPAKQPSGTPATKSGSVTKTAPATQQTAAAAAPQTKAPAWIEKALRARVEGMLAARKEGSFQKAYEFVAPDSRDYFFQMEKPAISSFKIEEIQWSGKFTGALVRISTIRKTRLVGVPGEVELPSSITDAWKVVGGRWLWWHDPALDRMGLLGIPTSSTQTAAADPGKKAPVPNDVSPAAVATAGQAIGAQVMLDKKSLTFTEGMEATEAVTYGNLNQGQIRVQAEMLFGPKGFTVSPVDTWLKPKESVKIEVHYVPGSDVLKQVTVRLYVEPFGKFYEIPVRITPASGK